MIKPLLLLLLNTFLKLFLKRGERFGLDLALKLEKKTWKKKTKDVITTSVLRPAPSSLLAWLEILLPNGSVLAPFCEKCVVVVGRFEFCVFVVTDSSSWDVHLFLIFFCVWSGWFWREKVFCVCELMAAAANDCSDSLWRATVHLIIFIPEKVGFLCCCRERTKIPLKGSGTKKTGLWPKKRLLKRKGLIK